MSSGSGSGSRVARIASAPPHDERAANGEQWRGVLDDDRQRREGTGCDEIERAQALGPGLGARIDDARVLRLGGRNRPLEEGASPGGAFHKSNAGLGKRDRQRAERTGPSSSPTSESARWSSIAFSGSRTAVGASGSSTSRRCSASSRRAASTESA